MRVSRASLRLGLLGPRASLRTDRCQQCYVAPRASSHRSAPHHMQLDLLGASGVAIGQLPGCGPSTSARPGASEAERGVGGRGADTPAARYLYRDTNSGNAAVPTGKRGGTRRLEAQDPCSRKRTGAAAGASAASTASAKVGCGSRPRALLGWVVMTCRSKLRLEAQRDEVVGGLLRLGHLAAVEQHTGLSGQGVTAAATVAGDRTGCDEDQRRTRRQMESHLRCFSRWSRCS